jgi:hypothetical protein
MREAVRFVRRTSPREGEAVKNVALELARRVARADLGFVAEIKDRRREMERRVLEARGVDASRSTSLENGRPPWAAESERLGSSVGLELSTEILPAPNLT